MIRKQLKIGDYIYTDCDSYSICYTHTNNDKFLIGKILDLYNDISNNPMCKVKWENTIDIMFGITPERVFLIKKYFKIISEPKALSLIL